MKLGTPACALSVQQRAVGSPYHNNSALHEPPCTHMHVLVTSIYNHKLPGNLFSTSMHGRMVCEYMYTEWGPQSTKDLGWGSLAISMLTTESQAV